MTNQQGQTAPKPKKTVSFIISELYEWIDTLGTALVWMIIVFTFFVRTSQVVGSSMYPTLEEGDMIMVSRTMYTPTKGDIVVITKPNFLGETLIKRIVATEGQEVDIDFEQGIVYVDGVMQTESFINEPTHDSGDVSFPMTVPQGEVFVMGDNRNASLDSRSTSIGTIDENYILGEAMLRVYPFDSIGFVNN